MGRKQRDKGNAVPERTSGPSDAPSIPVTLADAVTLETAPLRLAPVILACASLFAVMKWFWGFVQDDAYISLRYAWNLAHGNGLVFNPGERVEGFTNLTWTVLGALFIKLGIDPLDGLRVVGGAAAITLTVLVWLEAGGENWMTSRRDAWGGGFAAIVVASFTTVALWSVAGLEQSMFTLLAFAGYRQFALGRFPQAAGFWVAATYTRPEGPLLFALAVAVRGLMLFRVSKLPSNSEIRAVWIYGLGFAALIAYRLLYYGELAPNTYFVKGVANWASHQHGWNELKRFLDFNNIGVFVVIAYFSLKMNLWLAPWPWVPHERAESGIDGGPDGEPVRRPLEEVLYSALYLVVMFYYLVRVGGDLLPMFRLYMPLLPFLALWCGKAVSLLAKLVLIHEDDLDAKPEARRTLGPVLAVALSFVLAWFAYLAQKESYAHPEYKGTVIALDKCHGTAGRFLEAVAKQRGKPVTALAQDMGMTPWVAPHVRFVDVIGLTDHTVAHTLFSHDYTPYIRYLVWNEEGWQEKIKAMENKLRVYLESQQADYVLVNISCDAAATDNFRSALARLDPTFFQPYVEQNTFYYGLATTPEFKRDYRLLQGFEFSAVHFLLLYEKISSAAPASP